jgi:hypothetical protein
MTVAEAYRNIEPVLVPRDRGDWFARSADGAPLVVVGGEIVYWGAGVPLVEACGGEGEESWGDGLRRPVRVRPNKPARRPSYSDCRGMR